MFTSMNKKRLNKNVFQKLISRILWDLSILYLLYRFFLKENALKLKISENLSKKIGKNFTTLLKDFEIWNKNKLKIEFFFYFLPYSWVSV